MKSKVCGFFVVFVLAISFSNGEEHPRGTKRACVQELFVQKNLKELDWLWQVPIEAGSPAHLYTEIYGAVLKTLERSYRDRKTLLQGATAREVLSVMAEDSQKTQTIVEQMDRLAKRLFFNNIDRTKNPKRSALELHDALKHVSHILSSPVRAERAMQNLYILSPGDKDAMRTLKSLRNGNLASSQLDVGPLNAFLERSQLALVHLAIGMRFKNFIGSSLNAGAVLHFLNARLDLKQQNEDLIEKMRLDNRATFIHFLLLDPDKLKLAAFFTKGRASDFAIIEGVPDSPSLTSIDGERQYLTQLVNPLHFTLDIGVINFPDEKQKSPRLSCY